MEGGAIRFQAIADAAKGATGAKGKELFMPLRAALSGELHGPQMGAMVELMGMERVRNRLEATLASIDHG